MNKPILNMTLALTVGLIAGAGVMYYSPLSMLIKAPDAAPAPAGGDIERPLFYRNPMNPAITSPVPAKDEMGMDYIPVYAEKSKPAAEPLFYRNPMNPAITSPVPAQDEMGMDYIPVYADGADAGSDEPSGTVRIDPVVTQNIGVRIAAVQQRQLARQVRASARVSVDESRMTRLHPRSEGWIEKQMVSRIGDPVRRGDTLLQLYSPQLVSSQEEYLLALRSLESLQDSPYPDIRNGARELLDSAQQRLRLLDMSEAAIAQLKATGRVTRTVDIESPFTGVVLSIGAREGQFIKPGTELYMMADLSKVWLLADVYEYELPWVRVGDSATARITGHGDREFVGTLSYIYPYAEAKTRTVKVRLEFDNPDGLLRPDMFANVTIGADSRAQALVVPSEAIVRSGAREQVFVVRGEGKYEPREVELGYSSEGLVEIRSGLELGERVVSSALFLIDSESKLREATAKMMEAAAAPESNDLTMDGMSMSEMTMDGMSMDSMSMDSMSMDDLSMDDLSMDSMPMDDMRLDRQE